MLKQLGLLDDRASARQDGSSGVVIRSSARAKRLTLKVVPPYQIELVVPRGTRPRVVAEFLSSNREWIRRATDELETRYPPELRLLPASIELKAVDRRWSVDVAVNTRTGPRLRDRAGTLSLSVPSAGCTEGFELLRQWLLRRGREHLGPWLATEGQRLGVAPKRVQIRTQRTRWGSCSHQGSISLNAALLLLPAVLVRYLLVHELCHLRHLNHSRRYWRLVGQFDPNYLEHDKRLAASWAEIPVWALPR
jgi:predicted metal-dependent hydrolase